MINAKKKFQTGQIATYELIPKNLHDILMNDLYNKYLQSFLGVIVCWKESARQSLGC